MDFFSDRERGPRPRTKSAISAAAWGGILAAINSRVADGSLAKRYALLCSDSPIPCGTDEQTFLQALASEVPEFQLPLRPEDVPPALAIVDAIEFCFRVVSQAVSMAGTDTSTIIICDSMMGMGSGSSGEISTGYLLETGSSTSLKPTDVS